MAASLSLAPFPRFDTRDQPSSLGPRWTKWLARFETYLLACNIKDDTRRKRAMLLYCAGDEVHEIFDTLTDTGDDTDYATAVNKLTEYFTPRRNPVFEKFIFHDARPYPNETLDRYYTRLCKLASTCNFQDTEDQILSKIIGTYVNKSLRQTLLGKVDLTLETCLQIIRADELAETQSREMEKTSIDPHFAVDSLHRGNPQSFLNHSAVTNPRHEFRTTRQGESRALSPRSDPRSGRQDTASGSSPRRDPRSGRQDTASGSSPRRDFADNSREQHPSVGSRSTRYYRQCGNCGGPFPHPGGRDSCPAFNQICRACSKIGHFAHVCRSTTRSPLYMHNTQHRIHHVQHSTGNTDGDPDNDKEESVHIFAVTPLNAPKATIFIDGSPVEFLLDSCSSVNLLGEQEYNQLQSPKKLSATNVKIYPYGCTTPLTLLGCFTAQLRKDSSVCTATIYVLPIHYPATPILSFETLTALNCNLNIAHIHTSEYDTLLNEHSELFRGIGKLRNVCVKLHIDNTVPPVSQMNRRIPFHLRTRVATELQTLCDQDIIEPVNGPTTWVSPVVVIPKPGRPDEIRLCVDMRAANRAIKRQKHISPTMDDILHELNGAQYFSKLDLVKGYHQLELHELSRDITTFCTHLGLFRFKRLFFGVNSAAETFQKIIEDCLRDIPGTKNTSDDILIFGATKAAHDHTLRRVLDRLKEFGLTLNKSKCIFGVQEIIFNGHLFTKNGVQPDPNRTTALQAIPTPRDVSQLKSLLGLFNYCSRFIPNFSEITTPLRQLTKNSATWIWQAEHQTAVDTLKNTLLNSKLAYFDPQKTTVLTVDASPHGLGAILAQEDSSGCSNVIAYASRSLSPVESRYSQTEREALAATWSCEHFHTYLFGSSFSLITDHKPLIQILQKSSTKLPVSARIERWLLKLQGYDYHIIYRPGANNPADCLSRHPSSAMTDDHTTVQVTFLVSESCPKAFRLATVREETLKDPLLRTVADCIQNNTWNMAFSGYDANQKIFQNMRKCASEFAVVDGIILKQNRIVLPSSLHHRAIQLAHEGHLGIVKTKQLLRDKVWFAGMDELIHQYVQSCLPCQLQDNKIRTEPMKIMPPAPHPWSEVCLDFLGPLPTGHTILVAVDRYSRFPFAVTVPSTAATYTITALNTLFSIFGIPETIITDNGPPFQGHEFQTFLDLMGCQHRKITPYWPQANGLVERMMQPIMKAIRAAVVEKKPWKEQLETFLRSYRATPHSSTGVSPFELFLGRKMNIKIPAFSPPPTRDHHLEQQHRHACEKQKEYADTRRRASENTLKVGDTVLVRQSHVNKFSTKYSPDIYTIDDIKGCMITASSSSNTITRNASFFRPFSNGKLNRNDLNPDFATKRPGKDYTPETNSGSRCDDRRVETHNYNLRPRKVRFLNGLEGCNIPTDRWQL